MEEPKYTTPYATQTPEALVAEFRDRSKMYSKHETTDLKGNMMRRLRPIKELGNDPHANNLNDLKLEEAVELAIKSRDAGQSRERVNILIANFIRAAETEKVYSPLATYEFVKANFLDYREKTKGTKSLVEY